MAKLSFPPQRPDASPEFLWSIQLQLLSRAETLLGGKNPNKKIYQPQFSDNGPHIVNTPSLDGAFAALSKNAGGYWPTAVYELAHETVHLLDPIPGYTNWLEEGIAVEFSIAISRELTDHPMRPEYGYGNYVRATELVNRLPIPCFDAAKLVRGRIGSLSAATPENLKEIFSEADPALLSSLAERCIPR